MNTIKISKWKSILPHEVTYLEAFSNYTELNFYDGKKILICKTLKILQNEFNNFGFLRVNKKTLINQNYISKTADDFSFLWLENKLELNVSRRRRDYLKKNLHTNLSNFHINSLRKP